MIRIIKVLILCLTAIPALGAEPPRIGVGVTSLGLTLTPQVRFSPHFGARGMLGYANSSFNLALGSTGFDTTISSLTGAALVDYFPWGGYVRISGGVAFGGYNLHGSAASMDINGIHFDGPFTIDMRPVNKIAPMVTLGYEGRVEQYWTLSADVGVIMQTYATSVTSPFAIPVEVQDEIDGLNNRLADFGMVPFISIMMVHRF